MIKDNQFAVYQLKRMPETRQIRFLPYEMLLEKEIQIKAEDYEQVYVGTLHRQDTPESIRERLTRQLPRSFAGHSISVSDVLVLNRMGTFISYYVEKAGFTIIENFIKKESSSSGAVVSIDTKNFHIEGKAGSWLAFDSIRLDGQEFFLMEHETYGKEAAWVVVDQDGKLAVDNVRDGFDQEVKKKLEEYLHPSQPEEDRSDKFQLGNWQKCMENGEYLRSTEISEEQNYNMIDGKKNNGYTVSSTINSMPPKKKPKSRQSVLAKLHKKQAEIAKHSGKRERQIVVEDDMERKWK